MHQLTQEQANILATHQPRLIKEGDKWGFLKGKNTEVGIAGFGSTLQEAAIDFAKELKTNYNGKEYDHAFNDDEQD